MLNCDNQNLCTRHQASEKQYAIGRFVDYLFHQTFIRRNKIGICAHCGAYIIPPRAYDHPVGMTMYFFASLIGWFTAKYLITTGIGGMDYVLAVGALLLIPLLICRCSTAVIFTVFSWREFDSQNGHTEVDRADIRKAYARILFILGLIEGHLLISGTAMRRIIGFYGIVFFVVQITNKKKSAIWGIAAIGYALSSYLLLSNTDLPVILLFDNSICIIINLILVLISYSEGMLSRRGDSTCSTGDSSVC